MVPAVEAATISRVACGVCDPVWREYRAMHPEEKPLPWGGKWRDIEPLVLTEADGPI